MSLVCNNELSSQFWLQPYYWHIRASYSRVSTIFCKQLLIRFNVASVSIPRIHFTKYTKCNKCRYLWRQSSRYFHSFSSTCRYFYRKLWKYKDLSVFTSCVIINISSNNIKIISVCDNLYRGTKNKLGTRILEANESGTGILEKTKLGNNMGMEFEVRMNIGMVMVLARKVWE